MTRLAVEESPCRRMPLRYAAAMIKESNNIPLHWLWLGVAALGIAGLFALVLVIGRTPQLQALSVVQQFFSVALVVHVDLSVLVWFLCIGGMGWSWITRQLALAPTYWARTGFITTAVAAGMIALAPLNPHWEVLKSNYIPVLNNLTFLAGLAVLMAGLLIVLLPLVGALAPSRFRRLSAPQLCFLAAAFTTLLALAAFALSAHYLPPDLPAEERFNTLFWAGGHILQFTYTLLMMAGWVTLMEAISGRHANRTLVKLCCGLSLLGALISLAGFAIHPFDDSAFSHFQTRVMIEWGGLAPVLLAVGMVYAHFTRCKPSPGIPPYPPASGGIRGNSDLSQGRGALRHHLYPTGEAGSVTSPLGEVENRSSRFSGEGNRAYASFLIMSIILFAAGGVLGLMISGQNVTIPAHYHGAIVAVTLALMGLAIAVLPRFGYRSVAGSRLAFWQPIVYGVGQLMHVGGLAYSGGYGVLRKTAGGFANMTPDVKAALGVMGFGGLLAIIGGLLFVVIMLRARKMDNVAL